MKRTAYAHYKDNFCEYINLVPVPGKKMLKAFRAVREAKMDVQHVISDYHSIILPISGQADFTQYNKTIHLRQGTVAVRWPHKPYKFTETGDRTLEMFVFYFTGDVQPLWDRLFPKSCVGFNLVNGIEIIELTKAFFELAAKAPKEQTADICDLFAAFLLESLAVNQGHNLQPQPDPRLMRYVQYMERQFQNIRSAEDVARHFNVSRGTLHNLFKGSAYESPKKYLMQLKIKSATSLLTHTTWTLKEIAEELGYPNADTFSKSFKTATGRSPRAHNKGTT